MQVLFAFLLAVPFATGFKETTDFQRDLFFAILLATALASALLIAPTAYHRINFREQDKERLLKTANAMTLAGLTLLGASITGVVALIGDFVYGPAVPVICAIAGTVVFAGLWFVLPLVRRNPADTPGPEE